MPQLAVNILKTVSIKKWERNFVEDFKKPIAEDVIKLAGGEVKFLTVVKQD